MGNNEFYAADPLIPS